MLKVQLLHITVFYDCKGETRIQLIASTSRIINSVWYWHVLCSLFDSEMHGHTLVLGSDATFGFFLFRVSCFGLSDVPSISDQLTLHFLPGLFWLFKNIWPVQHNTPKPTSRWQKKNFDRFWNCQNMPLPATACPYYCCGKLMKWETTKLALAGLCAPYCLCSFKIKLH